MWYLGGVAVCSEGLRLLRLVSVLCVLAGVCVRKQDFAPALKDWVLLTFKGSTNVIRSTLLHDPTEEQALGAYNNRFNSLMLLLANLLDFMEFAPPIASIPNLSLLAGWA